MENEAKYREKLAKYMLIAFILAAAAALCWFFKTIIIYILIAVVVSLIAKPIMELLQKISIKGKRAPGWITATASLLIVSGIMVSIIMLLFPLASGIIQEISSIDIENAAKFISGPLSKTNNFLVNNFPILGDSFRLEVAIGEEVRKFLDISEFSSLIGSAASTLSSICVAIFSIVFISFFFIKDDGLFTQIVCSIVPDKYEKNTERAIADIGHLLSRYFIGVSIEILGVTLLNFLGLWLIARIGINAALYIALMTGIFNVIPYVGPLLGGVAGTTIALIIKYSSATPLGLDMGFWAFTAVLVAIFCVTQLVDNFLYQPVIYSTSIKAKPLEIFIVLLIVGHIAGPMAMIVAIPIYTVVRVVAFRFFKDVKAIKRLIPSEKLISDE